MLSWANCFSGIKLRSRDLGMYFWPLSCFRYYLDFVTGVIGDNDRCRLTALVGRRVFQFIGHWNPWICCGLLVPQWLDISLLLSMDKASTQDNTSVPVSGSNDDIKCLLIPVYN